MDNASIPRYIRTFHHPGVQILAAGIFMAIFVSLAKLFDGIAPETMRPRLPWITATASLLVYVLYNTIISLGTKRPAEYWYWSIPGFIGLALLGRWLATWYSGLSIDEAGTFRWLYFVVAFAYLVFISIVNLIRLIVAFAKNEIWLAPRIRNKKN